MREYHMFIRQTEMMLFAALKLQATQNADEAKLIADYGSEAFFVFWLFLHLNQSLVMPVVNLNKWAYRLVEDRHDGMGKVPVFDQEAFQLGITFKAKVSSINAWSLASSMRLNVLLYTANNCGMSLCI